MKLDRILGVTEHRTAPLPRRPWLVNMWARQAPLNDAGEGYEVRYGTARVAGRADFWGCYRPTGAVFHAQPGSVEHFVTERYCLYNVERGKVYRVPIHHLPWPLQPAKAEIARNTMAAANGITLADTPPLLHF